MGRCRARDVGWCALAMGVVVAAYAFVFARNRRFFFIDDLQHTLLATIYELGRSLRRGVWPIVQQRTWHSAFVAGDPQYGLFNPVTLLSYALVSREDDVAWGAFRLASSYACLVALGGYVACRAAGVRRSLAALGGASLATMPYVLYWNTASWHMGLVGYCWFVWALGALLFARRNPRHAWLLAVPTYLVFAGGWPPAVIALGLCCLTIGLWDVAVERVPLRTYVPVVLAVAAGAVAGLAPWIVSAEYLAIGRRESFWENTGFLTMHLEGLAGMFSPVSRPYLVSFFGARVTNQPITFVSVLVVTAIALCLLHRGRRLPDSSLVVAAAVVLAATLGPSQAGPTRWPFRYLPFGLVLVLVASLVVVSRASLRRLLPTTARGFLPVAGVGVLLLWLCFTQRPSPKHVLYNTAILLFGGVVLVALLERGRSALAIGLAWACAVAAFLLIVVTKPAMDEVPDLGAPMHLGDIEADVRVLDGERTVLLMRHVGPAEGVTIRNVPSGSYALFSRTAGPIVGGYSPVPLRRLSDALFCANNFGWSVCPDVVDRLFAAEPRTGLPHVDLLGATQILAQRGDLADTLAARNPAGWRRESVGEHLDRWVRVAAAPLPGDVTWASPRVTIRRAADGGAEVAKSDGGEAVFARPWLPGMRVTLDGRPLELSRLWGLYARAAIPPGMSGRLEIAYTLPRAGMVGVAFAAGAMLIVAAIVAGRRGGVLPRRQAAASRLDGAAATSSAAVASNRRRQAIGDTMSG